MKEIQQRLHGTSDAQKKTEHYTQFRTANPKCLESYLAYLDFLDALDAKEIHRCEEKITKIKTTMEKRALGRAEVTKALDEYSKQTR